MTRKNNYTGLVKCQLTPERLREIVLYDPRDGEFYWRLGGVATCSDSRDGAYRAVCFDGRKWSAHRLAFLYMTGEWPKRQVDHADGNPANNAWFNLRESDQSQNRGNSKVPSHNTSGHKGVSLSRGLWRAGIMVNGKTIFLGRFQTKEAAAAAYTRAAVEAFGPFARIA